MSLTLKSPLAHQRIEIFMPRINILWKHRADVLTLCCSVHISQCISLCIGLFSKKRNREGRCATTLLFLSQKWMYQSMYRSFIFLRNREERCATTLLFLLHKWMHQSMYILFFSQKETERADVPTLYCFFHMSECVSLCIGFFLKKRNREGRCADALL